MDSGSHRIPRRTCHLSGLCAALLLSPPATSAFAPVHADRKLTLTPRSSVIHKYRVEDESSDGASQPKPHQSDAYSFLPSRLSSSIKRVDRPSQFKAHVLGEKESLVVVRFYAEVCPSCRATGPLFRKWSRDIETYCVQSNIGEEGSSPASNGDTLSVKILEMPLNKENSAYFKNDLKVKRLPYCHLYHPEFGLVEEQLVMNKIEFDQFVNTVDCWSNGGCEVDLDYDATNYINCEIDCESHNDGECEGFC